MRVTVGIDPDCKKSGVAVIWQGSKAIDMQTLEFCKVLEYVRDLATSHDVRVFVEAGWLISHNWHTLRSDSVSVSAKKGYAVGRNHETGMKMVEVLRYMGVDVKLVKPLRKIWHGRDKKITHDELCQITKMINVRRTNQEERDAALIAFVNRV